MCEKITSPFIILNFFLSAGAGKRLQFKNTILSELRKSASETQYLLFFEWLYKVTIIKTMFFRKQTEHFYLFLNARKIADSRKLLNFLLCLKPMFLLSKECHYQAPLLIYRDSFCVQLLKMICSSINLSSVLVFLLVMNKKLSDYLSSDRFLLLRELFLLTGFRKTASLI